jgi:hypothetical protein
MLGFRPLTPDSKPASRNDASSENPIGRTSAVAEKKQDARTPTGRPVFLCAKTPLIPLHQKAFLHALLPQLNQGEQPPLPHRKNRHDLIRPVFKGENNSAVRLHPMVLNAPDTRHDFAESVAQKISHLNIP